MSKTIEKFQEELEKVGGYVGDWLDKGSESFALVLEDDNIRYDSYGSEDSFLRRVFHCPETGEYIELTGTRCSYEGEDWNTVPNIVKPVTKVITKFE